MSKLLLFLKVKALNHLIAHLTLSAWPKPNLVQSNGSYIEGVLWIF